MRFEQEPSDHSADAKRLKERLQFMVLAIDLLVDQVINARKKLRHLHPTYRKAVEDIENASKTSAELGAEIDLYVAMKELKFSPDLMNRIFNGVEKARHRRKQMSSPIPPSEH